MSKITRRHFFGAAAAAASADAVALSGSMFTNELRAQGPRKHVCLVHGAWHGGWAWTRLAPCIVEAGFIVPHPDLSGLGANSHRQSPEIG